MLLVLLLFVILFGWAAPDSMETSGSSVAGETPEAPAASVAQSYGTLIIRLHGDDMQPLANGSCAGDGTFAHLTEGSVISVVEEPSIRAVSLFEADLQPGTVTADGSCEWTVELGPMDPVAQFSITDRELLWGPYGQDDLSTPMVIGSEDQG